MSPRRYVVVTRAISGVRIREGQQFQAPAQTPIGPVVVTYRTRWSEEGFESPVPRELWAETVGEADCTIDEAINAYWNAANQYVPALAVVTNAPARATPLPSTGSGQGPIGRCSAASPSPR